MNRPISRWTWWGSPLLPADGYLAGFTSHFQPWKSHPAADDHADISPLTRQSQLLKAVEKGTHLNGESCPLEWGSLLTKAQKGKDSPVLPGTKLAGTPGIIPEKNEKWKVQSQLESEYVPVPITGHKVKQSCSKMLKEIHVDYLKQNIVSVWKVSMQDKFILYQQQNREFLVK